MRGAAEDRFLVLLRHAAQDADGDLRLALLDPLDPSQGAVDLVLGVLADRAGIVEDRIRLADVVGQLVALLAQLGHDELAVQQIHLAADRLDVQLLRGAGGAA